MNPSGENGPQNTKRLKMLESKSHQVKKLQQEFLRFKIQIDEIKSNSTIDSASLMRRQEYANSFEERLRSLAQYIINHYEGINVEPGEQPLYIREHVTAYQDGSPTTAWIYWFNGSISGLPEIASGDLLQYLQQKNKP